MKEEERKQKGSEWIIEKRGKLERRINPISRRRSRNRLPRGLEK